MAPVKSRAKIIDALLQLAAERAWGEVTLEALAERAGVSLAVLRGSYDGRVAVLEDFVRRVDESVLGAVDPDMRGEAPRERLFDVLFSRIEALKPHRAALRNLGAAVRRDPLLALHLNRIVSGSMAWMLAAAGIPATGRRGRLRAQGLALVWARVMRVWLDDEDAGLARTMAELDRQLRSAERTIMRLDRLVGIVCPPGRRRAKDARPPDEGDLAEGHPS